MPDIKYPIVEDEEGHRLEVKITMLPGAKMYILVWNCERCAAKIRGD